MDQLNFHKIASLAQSIKAHNNNLIKLTPLLVSLSLFPLLFSPSSLLSFLHHFNLYFSTLPLQLFTHTIDKNCMFLLCNGLLVFVGITKSLSWSNGSSDESSKYIEDDGSQSLYSEIESKDPMLVVKETQEKSNDHDEEVEENVENVILEEGKGSNQSDLKEEPRLLDEEEEKELEIHVFVIEEEEEEAVEEENCVLSTEELNKKIDDFIRKMKEDLRIEARRQLVMV